MLVLAILIPAAMTRIAAAQSGTWATILREGAEEYKENCAARDGADAKGGGDPTRSCSRSPMT